MGEGKVGESIARSSPTAQRLLEKQKNYGARMVKQIYHRFMFLVPLPMSINCDAVTTQ